MLQTISLCGTGIKKPHATGLTVPVIVAGVLIVLAPNKCVWAAEPDQADAGRLKIAVERLLDAAGTPTWKLEHVDAQPSVDVDGHRGYRIVLRRTWKEYTNVPQQVERPGADRGPFILKHENWQFVLIPLLPNQAAPQLKSQLPGAMSSSPYHTRDVCMGQRLGFVWFTHGTLFGQESVREKLKLRSGDDRIALMIDGMQVDDLHTMTANSCQRAIARFGDSALPAIGDAISQTGEQGGLNKIIGCLAFVHTDKATELLVQLYESEREHVRSAAAYALVREPFRRSAKDAYFDMLRRHQHVYESCRACLKFEWSDAAPILNNLTARPANLRELSFTIPARRTLQGNPIPQELLDAKQAIISAGHKVDQGLNRHLKILTESDDSEATLLIAIELATYSRKGSSRRINEVGIEILKRRPRESTMNSLRGLIDAMPPTSRKQAEQLIESVMTVQPSTPEIVPTGR